MYEAAILLSMQNFLESGKCDDAVCRRNLVTTVVALVDIGPDTYSEMIAPIIRDYRENLDKAYQVLLFLRAMEHGIITFDKLMLCQLYNELEVSNTERGSALAKAKADQACDDS